MANLSELLSSSDNKKVLRVVLSIGENETGRNGIHVNVCKLCESLKVDGKYSVFA